MPGRDTQLSAGQQASRCPWIRVEITRRMTGDESYLKYHHARMMGYRGVR